MHAEGGEYRLAENNAWRRMPRSGESRVAENNTRQRVAQGGGTGRCLHKGFFLKGMIALLMGGGECCVAENNARQRVTQGEEKHKEVARDVAYTRDFFERA